MRSPLFVESDRCNLKKILDKVCQEKLDKLQADRTYNFVKALSCAIALLEKENGHQ
ncbi:hypothetical protein I8748_25740 [Nostoc sp. CENA67]|uniref:Uncharacterized protein n=1 Tax=Amazonocrinis nigriterrae CENA67 TaxID=2794033 RepID=A0A8J7LD82_9NOST|nr:hypothetical protein [Amazonocrinis nigriterrae]MBH8565536.1 hypothetical protein [Amazonocrinis nigriterrae CENA67]